MNMPAIKLDGATPLSHPPARVVSLAPRRTPLATRLASSASEAAARIIPPALVIAVGLLLWELLCAKKGASLPPPSRVLADTWELIVDPFFDRGGLDKGLFWHMSASLQRVALGYALECHRTFGQFQIAYGHAINKHRCAIAFSQISANLHAIACFVISTAVAVSVNAGLIAYRCR